MNHTHNTKDNTMKTTILTTLTTTLTATLRTITNFVIGYNKTNIAMLNSTNAIVSELTGSRNVMKNLAIYSAIGTAFNYMIWELLFGCGTITFYILLTQLPALITVMSTK